MFGEGAELDAAAGLDCPATSHGSHSNDAASVDSFGREARRFDRQADALQAELKALRKGLEGIRGVQAI